MNKTYRIGVNGVLDMLDNNLWGVILAGGDGNRLKNFVEKLYGYHRPKQYCRIAGNKSLLQHTIERVQSLIPPNRLVTIANKNHIHYLIEELGADASNSIIMQPENRDTCAGILLPILKIFKKEPNAVIATFPTDHFMNNGKLFMNSVNKSFSFVNNNKDAIVLLGIKPDRVEQSYGCIEYENTESNPKSNIHRVLRFWEKPDYESAKRLYEKKCLWNTFVMVGTAESFIKYIKNFAPDVFDAFENIFEYLDTPVESYVIENEFKFVPIVNFSRFILEKIPKNLFVMDVPGVYWSDWGDEERINEDKKRFGLASIYGKEKHFFYRQKTVFD